MNRHGIQLNDATLSPFLNSGDATEAEQHLEDLIAHASTKIKSIIRNKLRVSLDPADCTRKNQDALEISGDINAFLLAQLQALKSDASSRSIKDFDGYVAVVSYHACYQYLRRIHPERWRLKNRLRYLLTHRPGLALWENNEGELFAGLAAHRHLKQARNVADVSSHLHDSLQTMSPSSPGKETRPSVLANLVTAVFQQVNGPVLLDDLVNLVVDLWGIADPAVAEGDEASRRLDLAQLRDSQLDLSTDVERRIYLEQLWKEICQLPVRHRAAILLNLRDSKGRGVITLLPLTRVATIRQVADAIEFPVEEFARVWKELPWDDKRIAQHLGLTRQQVINLRYSARARLASRLKGY